RNLMQELSGQSALHTLINLLARGEQSVGDLRRNLTATAPAVPISAPVAAEDLRIDVDRASRCGYPEVVYGPGKTPETVVTAFHRLLEKRQAPLATRCSPEQAAALARQFPQAIHNRAARTVRINRPDAPSTGRVLVVTAGTSDRPIAEEAVETLKWMHVGV